MFFSPVKTLFLETLRPGHTKPLVGSRRAQGEKGITAAWRSPNGGGNSKTGWELQNRAWLPPALHRMVSVWHQSTARAIRKHRIHRLSYRSRGTLMSYTDHSVQRRLKSNAPIDRQAHDTHAQFFLPINFSANSAPQLILKILLVVNHSVNLISYTMLQKNANP